MVVVWSGKQPLLPEREERVDGRLASMPSYDIDDGFVDDKPRRKYMRTGKHAGTFNRKRGYIPKDQRGER